MRITATDFRFGIETPRQMIVNRQWHFVNSKTAPDSFTGEMERLLESNAEGSFAVNCEKNAERLSNKFQWFTRLRVEKIECHVSSIEAVTATEHHAELRLTAAEIKEFCDLLRSRQDDCCIHVGKGVVLWCWASGLGL